MHILCNAGGEFAFIHNKHQYEGGETGLLIVDETCISYLDLLSRVKKFFAIESDSNIEIKYKYPGGSEVDDDRLVLVTLRNDDDMHNMISLQTNSLASMVSTSSLPPPIQLFMFQTSDQNQSTATNGTLLPLGKKEKASIKIEETGLKKQSTSSSDKLLNEKKRPKLVDMEWITGIAKARIERNLPCEEKDIMDEIRNEYGFDVDYNRAWTCRNRALRELAILPDEKKKEKKDDPMPSKPNETYVMSNMMNGPPNFPSPPPPMPDYDLSGLREDMSGLQAFLWEFRRNVLILLVVLLLLLLHFETR